MFTLKMETENAAFRNDSAADDSRDTAAAMYEVARILRWIAGELENDADHGLCMDANGNRVGEWRLT